MRTKALYSLIFCCILATKQSYSQDILKQVNEEQVALTQYVKYLSEDTSIVFPVARNLGVEIKSIVTGITSDKKIPADEKDKALHSLVYFMKALKGDLHLQRADVYEVPASLLAYEKVLHALLYHRPLANLILPLGPRTSQLMATSFSQYKEFAVLDEFTVYKRVVSSPEYILQFLESKPNFFYADSLLLHAAANYPLKMIAYLNAGSPTLQQKIRDTKNAYVAQLVAISGERDASELVPFAVPLSQGRISIEEIRKTRMEPVKYFQLMVDNLGLLRNSEDSASLFVQLTRDGIREKALSFYVKAVNELHNSADAVRFAAVKDLRPVDIYYVITTCGDDLYTSSYLGLYKRMMERLKGQDVSSLFDMVGYDNFHVFMRLAANYNVMTDFLNRLSPGRRSDFVQRFTKNVEAEPSSAVDNAMDIADSFTGLTDSSGILMHNELEANLLRCKVERNYLGIRLYKILLQVFAITQSPEARAKLWATLGNYEMLQRKELENKKGEIVQLVLFYGDEDGVASYGNFLRSYSDSSKWSVNRNPNFVSIRSRSDKPLLIYANVPLDEKNDLDIKAQDSLVNFMAQESLEPTVLVHRGHSYHLDKTLKRLQPSVKLAILGSCGSYNKAISLSSVNPDVQVIGSKKTGSKAVNDPIINSINETLMDNQDINWPTVWKKLAKRFENDAATLSLFNEYFSPNNNVSLFVLKLFYNQFAVATVAPMMSTE